MAKLPNKTATTTQVLQKTNHHGSKRKRSGIGDEVEISSNAKKITSERPSERPGADDDVDESIGHMDPLLFADHIAKKVKRAFRDMSSVELENRYLSQKIFQDTSNFELPRTLGNLSSFLEHHTSKKDSLSRSCEAPGSPQTLIIAASGMRAADVTRSLRKYQAQDCAVAKLFAKHIKLKDAIDYVKRTRIGIGVGTPQRLVDLLENDVLKTDSLERVVIDASHIDQKRRSILDMRELLEPLIKLLSTAPLKDKFATGNGPAKVLAF